MDLGRTRVAIRGTLTLAHDRLPAPPSIPFRERWYLLARFVAESLGIDVDSGLPQVFATANGPIEAFGHSVQLSVLEMHFDALVYFFANENIRKNLLGRRGWLDRVLFGLDEYRQIIYLSNVAVSTD